MKKILVVGSIAYDTVTTPSGTAENALGGSATYFSHAASQYSAVNVVGVVGKDFNMQAWDSLKNRGVDISGIKIEQGQTFRWSGSYLKDLNEAETLKTELNVLKSFHPQIPESYKKSEFVFLANIDPVLQLDVLNQIGHPELVGLDTMNYWIDSKIEELKRVLARVQIFLLNETEALKLSGLDNIVSAVKKLRTMGPKTIVVKRGEYGFFMFHEDRFFVLPAFPVENVVDPTGAGDSFAGGFFGYLSKNGNTQSLRTLQEACIHGSVVASFCVQGFGPSALEKLDPAAIERRMRDYMQVVSLA